MNKPRLFIQQQGSGKPIVLLHGWGMHSGIWDGFASRLASTYKVICVDLPGFGKSEALEKFDLETICAHLMRVLPEQSFTCLGWSMGGLIGIALADKYPERVKNLILMASNPCFVEREDWPGISPVVLEAFARGLLDEPENTIKRFLSLQVHAMPHARQYLEQMKQQLFKVPVPASPVLIDGLNLLKQSDLRHQLFNLSCPVLALFGRLDTLVPVKLVQTLTEYCVEGLQIEVLPHAGHLPFVTHQEETLSRIQNFCQ